MANIYRAVRDADKRNLRHIVKDENAADPPDITALLAATTGGSLVTLTEEQGATLEIGLLIADDGTVSEPATENAAELIDPRGGLRAEVGEWVQANGGTVGFLHYAAFVNEAKAKVYEAVQRMAYLHTHENTVLQTEAHRNKLIALIAIEWTDFVRLVDPTATEWNTPSNLLDSMRNGTEWRLIQPGADGNYIPVVDPSPPAYTFQAAHQEAYEDLLASLRVAPLREQQA